MPAPTTLDTIRTGTPDNADGITLAQISAQESATKEIVAGVSLSDRIADAPSADRSGLSGNDAATTDMSTASFAGSSGANLLAINNRGALVVWCEFANSAGLAVVEIIFYDNANNPLFVSEQLYFSAKTNRVSASGDYMSQAQIIDTYGASKYRPFLRTIGTGNVDIFAHPI